MEEKTWFKLIVYLDDYDIGTGMAVHSDMPWMDVYDGVLAKLNIERPKCKEPIVETSNKWCYALGHQVCDLGDFRWGQAVTISLRDSEFP